MHTAEFWIEKLHLRKHPEGGYFNRTYCSQNLACKNPQRHTASMIYYLLHNADKSQFHRLTSDEIWLHHLGSSVEIHVISPEGKFSINTLGPEIEAEEKLQIIIPAHHWFAAKNKNNQTYSLVSCVVSPSFDFNDFEMTTQSELEKKFPKLKKELCKFYE